MTTLFSISSQKIHKSDIFGPKFRHFCFFREILEIDKFEGADFKSDNSSFNILAQKYPNKEFFVKNIKIRHFWSQNQSFSFLQFCSSTNLKVLISNMTIVFLKFQPKNTQIRHFWSKIQAFSLFHHNLQLDKFKGADFKYDISIFLKNSSPKIPKFLHKISELNKFQGADFKYDNSFLKF